MCHRKKGKQCNCGCTKKPDDSIDVLGYNIPMDDTTKTALVVGGIILLAFLFRRS